MIVSRLRLQNFRNYRELDVFFEENVNMFYGGNGQGKTNIIEAIYLISSVRSHRTAKEKDLIRFGETEAKIELFFSDRVRDFHVELRLFAEKNHEIYINDIKCQKNSELIGLFSAVLFSPEDFSMIKEGPSERRRFLNIAIAQMRPQYFQCLVEYQRVLRSKNKALKEGGAFLQMLDIYQEKLSVLGAKIIRYRAAFIEALTPHIQEIYKQITLTDEDFCVCYDSCVPLGDEQDMQKALYRKMQRAKERELLEKTSVVGPHREDLSFQINQKQVKEFASQGQQRTAILTLKLAQAELLKAQNGEYPVLLLDDILSELDATRRKFLLSDIKNKQVFITGTDKAGFGRRKDTKLFHIEQASVEKE